MGADVGAEEDIDAVRREVVVLDQEWPRRVVAGDRLGGLIASATPDDVAIDHREVASVKPDEKRSEARAVDREMNIRAVEDDVLRGLREGRWVASGFVASKAHDVGAFAVVLVVGDRDIGPDDAGKARALLGPDRFSKGRRGVADATVAIPHEFPSDLVHRGCITSRGAGPGGRQCVRAGRFDIDPVAFAAPIPQHQRTRVIPHCDLDAHGRIEENRVVVGGLEVLEIRAGTDRQGLPATGVAKRDVRLGHRQRRGPIVPTGARGRALGSAAGWKLGGSPCRRKKNPENGGYQGVVPAHRILRERVW